MADYGVLKTMRQILNDSIIIKEAAGKECVHFAVPPEVSLPMILLELEEIWTSLRLGETSAHVRVKFKASMMANTPTGKDAMLMADAVKHAIDGKTIDVEDGMTATMRLAGSIIDLLNADRPRVIHQYYEALIRG